MKEFIMHLQKKMRIWDEMQKKKSTQNAAIESHCLEEKKIAWPGRERKFK